MINRQEIARMLASDAEGVARHLYPNGKKNGGEWEVGSIHGEAGKSLKIRLSGSKAGKWSDFADGEQSGDLLALFVEIAGDFLQGKQDALRYLGVQDSTVFENKKRFDAPVIPKCKPVETVVTAFDYLASRNITPETMAAYKIAAEPDAVIFPYLRSGERVMCKRLKIERIDGKKDIRPTSANQEHTLFGWQAVSPKNTQIIIAEGEIDAMSWHCQGFEALSVPFGAGVGAKQQWIENDWEHLEQFDQIFIAMDGDAAGQSCVAEIAKRLGVDRCWIVRLPSGKDANDLHMDGESLGELISNAKPITPDGLYSISDLRSEAHAAFDSDEDHGMKLPANKFCDWLRFRESELILLNGINGHGKSQVLGHILVEAMALGERCCIYSGELSRKQLLRRMLIQNAGLMNDKPSHEFIDAILNHLNDKFWSFEMHYGSSGDRLLSVFEYAHKRFGCKIFAIDSLMKCGIGEDDYNGQKLFVEKVAEFKQRTNTTVFMVTHNKKMENEKTAASKMGIKGSGSISDLADTNINIWRNKIKEEKLEQAAEDDDLTDIESMPDSIWTCDKQRNGEGEKTEGKIGYYWHANSMQFLPTPNAKPIQYVRFSSRGERAA